MKTLKTLLPAALGLAIAAPATAQTLTGENGGSVTFSGFVDSSVVIPLAADDASDQVTFGLDQVELDIEATPVAGSGLTIRTDLNVFPADTSWAPDDLVEQGYADWELESGYFLRAGKANVPFGAEGIDPVDLYQYSASQMPIPTNLTGLFTGYRSDSFSGQVWVTNGPDMPNTERSVSTGARLEYAFDPGHVALSFMTGPLTSDDPTHMLDFDTNLAFGDLTILGEFNMQMGGTETIGFATTFSYALSEMTAATLRFDYLAETLAADTAAEVTASNAGITVAGLFTLTDNFGLVAEVATFVPNNDGDVTSTAALELLAWW